MQLAKTKVCVCVYMYVCIYKHGQACKPTLLDDFTYLPFFKVFVFKVFSLPSSSIPLCDPSLTSWLASKQYQLLG